MRAITLLREVTVLVVAATGLVAAPGITAPSATVGRNLQTSVAVHFERADPQARLTLTVTSDDPSRLLLADAPEKKGSTKISLTILPRVVQSPEFWLQGLADSGTATYTVSVEGMDSVKGTVTLAPSAVVILGPSRTPKFQATPRAAGAKISIVTASLDGSRKVSQAQPLACGSPVDVAITNSNPGVGKLNASKLTLECGTSTATTYFVPAGEGETTLVPVQPPGFTTALQYANVVAAVTRPGLSIVGEVFLGKDLQIEGVLCLGEPAPPGGLEVTLASSDPSKLVLSPRSDQPGSGSIKITVPAGELTAQYSIQGIGDSGDVTYEATAPGYRNRIARVGLTPSGIIVAYEPYGPPDEATVLRKAQTADDRKFYASLADAKHRPVKLVVWAAHLDRVTGQAADITVQQLRPGVSATVTLSSSNPAVGTVQTPLTIKSGASHAVGRFTPLSKGTTLISIDTPQGFTTPKNATKVPANVND